MSDLNSIAERNARMSALGQYFRWLLKYYTSAELAEMSDESDPVSLRQIFVPMRVGEEELVESAMVGPTEVADKETEATLPGVDVFELIQQERFICLSGLPGSGKTTLIKALLMELCAQHPSRLRNALAGRLGIAPVPLMLREFSDLDTINTFDKLMDAWWRNLENRTSQGDALDIDRLKFCFSPEGDGLPLLLLFDGIDETGGVNIRKGILNIAADTCIRYGYRILVTGRPNGFEGLKLAKEKGLYASKETTNGELNLKVGQPFHLLPLSWPQIQGFINKWYQLRPEWEIKHIEGAAHFLEALQDNNRSYLLPLARRPIFLTLMSLVHCTRNEMPHGRAELYEAIVDLYLNRQERHRQIKHSVKGKALKAWPPLDKRRVLGHIAYQSQIKGSEQNSESNNPDQRRILWPRAELLYVIRDYLQNKSGFGIAPEDAEDLLEYFLHPAGLLIEPREGEFSFAHLSFQEYLCAEDVQRRLMGFKAEQIFRKELIANLDKPGWDEVGLLLLVIHKSRSDDGHLELLELLDAENESQARLWVQAVCGKELALSAPQQVFLLPKIAACCLRHPIADLPQFWRGQDIANELNEPGLRLLLDLLRSNCPTEDFHWLANLDAADRLHRLLALAVNNQWGCQNDARMPINSSELEQTLTESLFSEELIWKRHANEEIPAGLPNFTDAGFYLDALVPTEGNLRWRVLSLLPVDAWLLQGENLEHKFLLNSFSPPLTSIVLLLYSHSTLPPRTRLAAGFYQAIILFELGGCGQPWHWSTLSLSRLLFRSLMQFLPNLQNPPLLSISRGMSRSVAPLRVMSISPSPLQLLSRLQSPNLARLLEACTEKSEKFRTKPHEPPPNVESLMQEQGRRDTFDSAIERFGYHYAALDWFQEQAENPDLVLSRGLRPGEPLPKILGLFDDKGIPFDQQHKENWQQLLLWLNDDDAVLAFFFPEGLEPADETVLRKDLGILKQQPWSPQAFVQATLDQWPVGKDLDFSYAEAERRMMEACEVFLRAAGQDEADKG